MDIFNTLLIALFIATGIFYIVFFSVSYYWHEKNTSYVIVPMIFTFEFFVIGFFVVAIASIVIQYLPIILKLTS